VAERRKDSRKGPEERPIWGKLVRCIDKSTGEEFIGWRAYAGEDAQEMRRRGYREGDELSTEFRTDRNLKNFRQAHALAGFVRDNHDSFDPNMDNHAALKQIQRDADIECDHQQMEIDLGSFGKHMMDVRTPRSLSFSTMPDEMWRRVFKRFKDYCIAEYFPAWGPDEIAQFEEILRGNLPP
jgi:hypothetical protein